MLIAVGHFVYNTAETVNAEKRMFFDVRMGREFREIPAQDCTGILRENRGKCRARPAGTGP